MAILKQRGGAPAWELDSDAHRGLMQTVRDGQPRLALEYVQVLINAQREEIDALKAEVESMKKTIMDLARMSTNEKPVAARAKAEKPAESAQ